MLTKRIVPCLDVSEGRVVKGTHFESLRDAGDPVELASRYVSEGADELVFLDISASEQGRKTTLELVSRVATVLDIPFTVGGGISSADDARAILLGGADKVGINTSAVKSPQIISDLAGIFGRQCVVVAIDAKRNYSSGGANMAEQDGKKFWYEVFVYGGKEGTGIDAVQWAKEAAGLGAGEILLTSIDADGTGGGYDLDLTSQVASAVRVPVVASGGCGSPGHMAELFAGTDADAALAASIFHYDSHGVRGTKEFLRRAGVPVRL